jgi:hypothetical protein
MSKNTLIAIVVIILVVLLGTWWYIHSITPKVAMVHIATQSPSTTLPSTPVVTQTTIPVSQVPNGFPSDIPLEQGVQITQNYTTQTNGQSQAGRVWVTNQTLSQQFDIYQNFFANKKNGWTIESTQNETAQKTIVAKKGDVQILVNINQNAITGVKTVSISAITESD